MGKVLEGYITSGKGSESQGETIMLILLLELL